MSTTNVKPKKVLAYQCPECHAVRKTLYELDIHNMFSHRGNTS